MIDGLTAFDVSARKDGIVLVGYLDFVVMRQALRRV